MIGFTLRSKWAASAGIVALVGATGAGAATLHRFAITQATGSGGAQTVLQSSASGSALQGEVASSAQTAIKIPFGVLGEYDATGSTFGSGVLGISTTGYGVGAESLSASQPSLLGLNSSGGPGGEMIGKNGGDALDVTGVGGAGLYATSDTYSAVSGYGSAPGYAAIYGEDDTTTNGYAMLGESFSDGGVGSFGYSGAANGGVGVAGEAENATQGLPALQAVTATDGTELFDAAVSDTNTGNQLSVSTVLSSVSQNLSGTVTTAGVASSDLQINGDIVLSGNLFTNCGTSVPYATSCGAAATAIQKSSSGTSYAMYSAEHASKTVEDEGEAALRGGYAHVTLDPSFASVISKNETYLVFTTPQGDTRGLYVTNRTAQGFDVRETSGGRSTLTFDYRIVAHPFGERVARMSVSRPPTRTNARAGRPVASRALAAHEALFAHTRANARKPHTFASHVHKLPADLMAPASLHR